MTDADKLAAFNRILAARPRTYHPSAETDFLFTVLRETRPFVDNHDWPEGAVEIYTPEKGVVLNLLWSGKIHCDHRVARLPVTDADNRYLCSCGSAWRFRSETIEAGIACEQGMGR